jgi:hypothetical protein
MQLYIYAQHFLHIGRIDPISVKTRTKSQRQCDYSHCVGEIPRIKYQGCGAR